MVEHWSTRRSSRSSFSTRNRQYGKSYRRYKLCSRGMVVGVTVGSFRLSARSEKAGCIRWCWWKTRWKWRGNRKKKDYDKSLRFLRNHRARIRQHRELYSKYPFFSYRHIFSPKKRQISSLKFQKYGTVCAFSRS